MKLEKQVCRPDQSKTLAGLGIKGETLLYWVEFCGLRKSGFMLCRPSSDIEYKSPESLTWVVYGDVPDSLKPALEKGVLTEVSFYPAYSLAELGIMMPPFFPSFVHDNKLSAHCKNERVDTFPFASASEAGNIITSHILSEEPVYTLNEEQIPVLASETEAWAKASMFIHLLKNGYAIAQECNDFLNKERIVQL